MQPHPRPQLQRYTGPAVTPFLEAVARLRIQVFREWPYLYDGDMDYERHYLETYCRAPHGLFVLVRDGERIVGVSTGVPLADETPEFQQPFLDQGYDPARIFYFGEFVLLPEYRGLGLGGRLLVECEDHARALGGFDSTALCAVDRPAAHPSRPPDYRPLDGFWASRGYVKQPHLTASYVWKDLDEPAPTAKPMIFWLKRLEP